MVAESRNSSRECHTAYCHVFDFDPRAVGKPDGGGVMGNARFVRQTRSRVSHMDCNGLYQGKIVKVFPRPGENPSTLRCSECEGGQKKMPQPVHRI
jgi:hypothetical protein